MTKIKPYGGAVRRCSECPPSPSAKWSPVGDFDNCNSGCVGGWVPVDITEPDQCPECGYWFDDEEEGCDACIALKGTRVPLIWAYPQPGDIVLTEKDDLFPVEAVWNDEWLNIGPINTVTLEDYPKDKHDVDTWHHPSRLRLVVDHPNTCRIPGTQPPT